MLHMLRRSTPQEHDLLEYPLVILQVLKPLSRQLTAVFRYMDKSGLAGSRLQMINGVFLLASFIGLRIVFGGYIVRHPGQTNYGR